MPILVSVKPLRFVQEEMRNIELSVNQLAQVIDGDVMWQAPIDDKLHSLVTKSIIHASKVELYKMKASISGSNAANYLQRASSHAHEIGKVLLTIAGWSEANFIFCDPVLAVSASCVFDSIWAVSDVVAVVHIIDRFGCIACGDCLPTR